MNSQNVSLLKDQEGYVSAPAYLDLYDVLIKFNVISDTENVGIDREDLLNVEKRIPISKENELWNIAKLYGAPDHIGLITGGQINPEAKGMLSHLVSYSKDLREALSLFDKYICLMSDIEFIEIEDTDFGCRIHFNSIIDRTDNISSIERSMSSLLTWGRYLTNTEFYPIGIYFKHKKPNYYSEYINMFGKECIFETERNSMDIDNKTLNFSVTTSNDYIKNILCMHVNKFCKLMRKENSLIYKVKDHIECSLKSGYFSSSDVSVKMNMSRQTLHRKLKEYDVCFRSLLEDVRKEKAIMYLSDKGMPLEKIGFNLGFKETSAFFRAFKSWFDITPGQYRKKYYKS